MSKRSAGLLIHRETKDGIEILLVHPGGPFWARRDEGAWSIPKGQVEPGEDELAAARREAREELGVAVEGRFEPLGDYRQPGGKVVVAWAVEADPVFDAAALASNTFSMEWPPKSGVTREFPEVDRAAWFAVAEAGRRILKGQAAILGDFLARRARDG